MEIQLKDRVAIVTGAGGVYGRKIAQTLSSAGVRVAVNDINPDRAQFVSGLIGEQGGESIPIVADVANKFQCVNLVETTRQAWGRLDILVNSAIVRPNVSIIKLDEWEWQRCLDVNLKGMFFMNQLCGRVMADENQQEGAVIVNLAETVRSADPVTGQAAFAASQAAVIGFTTQCAQEYASFGIGVHCLRLQEGSSSGNLSNQIRGEQAQVTAEKVLHICSETLADRQTVTPSL